MTRISQLLAFFLLLPSCSLLAQSSILLEGAGIGGGQIELDITRTYSGLQNGQEYQFEINILSLTSPVEITGGLESYTIASTGVHTLSFETISSTLELNLFMSSSINPILELEYVQLDLVDYIFSPIQKMVANSLVIRVPFATKFQSL